MVLSLFDVKQKFLYSIVSVEIMYRSLGWYLPSPSPITPSPSLSNNSSIRTTQRAHADSEEKIDLVSEMINTISANEMICGGFRVSAFSLVLISTVLKKKSLLLQRNCHQHYIVAAVVISIVVAIVCGSIITPIIIQSSWCCSSSTY